MEFFEAKIRAVFFLTGLLFFLFLELTHPYRLTTVSKLKRWMDNLGLTLFNNIFLSLIFSPLIVFSLGHVQAKEAGILQMTHLSYGLKVALAVIFMDFIIYLWHLLNHVTPLLWRFHRVHHSDLNMDVSTATRFHTGELAISIFIKASMILLLGLDVVTLLIFEILLLACAQFQHSSLKIPGWFGDIYWILFVPPSMHRIHHSVIIKERNTNYGTIFSVWDRIFGTLLKNVDQEGIRIGIGAYPGFEGVRLPHLLYMPFTKEVK